MIELIGGLTSDLLTKALDRSALEHRLISNNIANVNTPGFRPQTTAFSQTLGQLDKIFASGNVSAKDVEALVADWNPEKDIQIDPTQEKVELDREMVNISRNTIHYQALLTAKSGLGDILKSAVRGGR